MPRPTTTTSGSAVSIDLVARADSLARVRRYEEAASQYVLVLGQWPESVEIARRALGSFWHAGRFDDAYIWGHRVLARDPRSLDALFDVGVTCGFLVDLPCVDSIFRRAVALDSSFVDGYGELAFLAQAGGHLSEAIQDMERAYAAAPQNDFAVSGLAQMLIPAGQAARARSLMEPRLAVNRGARAYGGRSMLTLYGWALLATGDTAGASAAFNEVLGHLWTREQAGETTYQLFRERAAIYALQGDRSEAIHAMDTAFAHGWRLYGASSLVDPMFASVANDPRVVALVERMRDDLRTIRRRLAARLAASP